MNTVEPLDESEGACTGGNFPGYRPRVKQHGAILGMQMQRNRARFVIRMVRRTRHQMCTAYRGISR
jgi:hypothetical protein